MLSAPRRWTRPLLAVLLLLMLFAPLKGDMVRPPFLGYALLVIQMPAGFPMMHQSHIKPMRSMIQAPIAVLLINIS